MTDKKDHIQWTAPDARAVFLLVHGLGTYAGRWAAMAEFFRENGISSYAVNLPKLDSICAYYRGILCLRDTIGKECPGKKIFLVGESLGGLASFIFSAEHPGSFAGLVCMSPAFGNRKKLSALKKLEIAGALLFAPLMRIDLPFDSAMCTRDVDCRRKLDSDPLEYRSATVRLIIEIMKGQAHAKSIADKLETPVLFLLSGEDKIVDPQASRDIFSRLAVKDKALQEFNGMYHALSIELGKEAVFDAVLKWIDRRT